MTAALPITRCIDARMHDLVLCRKPSSPALWVAKCITPGCMYSVMPTVALASALSDMKRVEDDVPC